MRIEVEPQELIGAGKQVGSLGTQLGALSDAMSQVLSGGIASGTDAAGLNFGISYGRQADDFGSYLAQLANSFKSVGLMLEATGLNYQHSDQASTAGGSGPTGAVSGEQAETKAGDAPYAPVMSLVPPPPNWWLIQPLLNMIPLFGVAMTWPTGDSGMMNVTAAQWTNIGRGLKVFEPALQAASMAAGAQDIPEVGQITQALKDIGEGATKLATVADGIGTAITDFARGVQETQDSIRRLLDRLSFGGLVDTVTGFFTGEGMDTLREIANDVGNVLENFQNQVQGVLGLLDELATLLGEAADAFNKWARPILVATFGDDAGNLIADGLELYTDFEVGLGAAVIGLVSGTVALADPATWKGLADTAVMIAKDPTKIDDVLLQAGGEFIAWDELTGDNPARGVGEAFGNIGSLFIPGGAFAKGGSVAKGLNFTRNLLEKGDLGPLGRLPGLGGHRTPDMPELPDTPGVPHVPEFTPPAGIPGSVLNPPGAGPGSPSTPASPSAPGSPGSSNGNAPVRPQGGDPGGPSPTSPSPNGSPDGGAGPGSPSSGGPAPTGGSPSPGGGDGPSSNGPVPTGGSPSPSGGDAPSGGSQSSPSVSSPSDSPGSSGPSKGGEDGPGPSSSGGGSNSGGGSSGDAPSGDGPSPDVTDPNSPDSVPPQSADGGADQSVGPRDNGPSGPGDDGRIYTMSDGTSHQTSFAPEQLGDNHRVADALERHGVSREDFIDLVNRPIDALSPSERDLLTAVRDDLPEPGIDTVMQKVIPPGAFGADGVFKPGGAENYLDGPYSPDGMRGAVTVADDTAHLGTPGTIHDGLRLDYDDTPFTPNDSNAHVIRFQTDPASGGSFDVPRHSTMGGSGDYDGWGDPFTGNGFTKAADDVVPEYGANDIRMREGAEMWEILDDGTQRLVAVLQRDVEGNASWLRFAEPK